jgi:protein involved in polysaccharide export with SLBB domain
MTCRAAAVRRGPEWLALVFLACAIGGGCAAFSNPVADAVPVRKLPPEVLGQRKDELREIPFTCLRQKPPDIYRLDVGDILGVWIEGVLGEKGQPPPVQISQDPTRPPALGYPIPVREDGTLLLPLVEPVQVKGLSLAEATQEIIKAYTVTKKILQPGRERVTVTLARPREYRVLVVREDSGGLVVGPQGGLGQTKRGTGFTLDLPAYDNDVLTALARTGGLPGLDAQNEVIIERGYFSDTKDGQGLAHQMVPGGGCGGAGLGMCGGEVTRIPLRLRPGEQPPFRPEDIVLNNGDIVFIPARDSEFYYTGGLLPPQQVPLPRDYDLGVVEAIARINGPLVNGGFNINNLSGNIQATGYGSPSPSLVTVLRRTANGGQIPIRVSLNRALRDPRENLLVQAGDVLILQETLDEALSRYWTSVYRSVTVATLIRRRDLNKTDTLTFP